MLNGLDLFSGIGGITLALKPWVRPIAYCESEKFAQGVLMSRMSDGSLPRAPIWDDVRTLTEDLFGSEIDIIYGGFPCQDISSAGRGAGMGGERSGLFQHIGRLVAEINPRFVFLENVPAIRTRGLNSVAQTFAELGYDFRWTVISAEEIGAPHLRKRWFFLASTANSPPLHGPSIEWDEPDGNNERPEIVANSMRERSFSAAQTGIHSEEESGRPRDEQSSGLGWWAIEPAVGRVAHGVPFRVDRLRGLGNSVVPAQAREAFMRLMGLTDYDQESRESK